MIMVMVILFLVAKSIRQKHSEHTYIEKEKEKELHGGGFVMKIEKKRNKKICQ